MPGPQGTLVQRHRQFDNFVASADTAVYDAFGVLDADVDGLNGGTYTARDSVGYLGQSGRYTDTETAPIAPGGLLSVGGGYYDARQGRYVTRGGDVNGYAAQGNNPASFVDWLGVAQTTADAVGLVPVLNVPASVVSGGISASRGDWAGAGLSLLAVVPLEGEGWAAFRGGVVGLAGLAGGLYGANGGAALCAGARLGLNPQAARREPLRDWDV